MSEINENKNSENLQNIDNSEKLNNSLVEGITGNQEEDQNGEKDNESSDPNPLSGLIPGLGLYERDKNPDAQQVKPNLIVSVIRQLITMFFFVIMVSSILWWCKCSPASAVDKLFPSNPKKSPYGDSAVNITQGDWRSQCTSADEKSAQDAEGIYVWYRNPCGGGSSISQFVNIFLESTIATNSTLNLGLNMGATAIRQIFGAQKTEASQSSACKALSPWHFIIAMLIIGVLSGGIAALIGVIFFLNTGLHCIWQFLTAVLSPSRVGWFSMGGWLFSCLFLAPLIVAGLSSAGYTFQFFIALLFGPYFNPTWRAQALGIMKPSIEVIGWLTAVWVMLPITLEIPLYFDKSVEPAILLGGGLAIFLALFKIVLLLFFPSEEPVGAGETLYEGDSNEGELFGTLNKVAKSANEQFLAASNRVAQKRDELRQKSIIRNLGTSLDKHGRLVRSDGSIVGIPKHLKNPKLWTSNDKLVPIEKISENLQTEQDSPYNPISNQDDPNKLISNFVKLVNKSDLEDIVKFLRDERGKKAWLAWEKENNPKLLSTSEKPIDSSTPTSSAVSNQQGDVENNQSLNASGESTDSSAASATTVPNDDGEGEENEGEENEGLPGYGSGGGLIQKGGGSKQLRLDFYNNEPYRFPGLQFIQTMWIQNIVKKLYYQKLEVINISGSKNDALIQFLENNKKGNLKILDLSFDFNFYSLLNNFYKTNLSGSNNFDNIDKDTLELLINNYDYYKEQYEDNLISTNLKIPKYALAKKLKNSLESVVSMLSSNKYYQKIIKLFADLQDVNLNNSSKQANLSLEAEPLKEDSSEVVQPKNEKDEVDENEGEENEGLPGFGSGGGAKNDEKLDIIRGQIFEEIKKIIQEKIFNNDDVSLPLSDDDSEAGSQDGSEAASDVSSPPPSPNRNSSFNSQNKFSSLKKCSNEELCYFLYLLYFKFSPDFYKKYENLILSLYDGEIFKSKNVPNLKEDDLPEIIRYSIQQDAKEKLIGIENIINSEPSYLQQIAEFNRSILKNSYRDSLIQADKFQKEFLDFKNNNINMENLVELEPKINIDLKDTEELKRQDELLVNNPTLQNNQESLYNFAYNTWFNNQQKLIKLDALKIAIPKAIKIQKSKYNDKQINSGNVENVINELIKLPVHDINKVTSYGNYSIQFLNQLQEVVNEKYNQSKPTETEKRDKELTFQGLLILYKYKTLVNLLNKNLKKNNVIDNLQDGTSKSDSDVVTEGGGIFTSKISDKEINNLISIYVEFDKYYNDNLNTFNSNEFQKGEDNIKIYVDLISKMKNNNIYITDEKLKLSRTITGRETIPYNSYLFVPYISGFNLEQSDKIQTLIIRVGKVLNLFARKRISKYSSKDESILKQISDFINNEAKINKLTPLDPSLLSIFEKLGNIESKQKDLLNLENDIKKACEMNLTAFQSAKQNKISLLGYLKSRDTAKSVALAGSKLIDKYTFEINKLEENSKSLKSSKNPRDFQKRAQIIQRIQYLNNKIDEVKKLAKKCSSLFENIENIKRDISDEKTEIKTVKDQYKKEFRDIDNLNIQDYTPSKFSEALKKSKELILDSGSSISYSISSLTNPYLRARLYDSYYRNNVDFNTPSYASKLLETFKSRIASYNDDNLYTNVLKNEYAIEPVLELWKNNRKQNVGELYWGQVVDGNRLFSILFSSIADNFALVYELIKIQTYKTLGLATSISSKAKQDYSQSNSKAKQFEKNHDVLDLLVDIKYVNFLNKQMQLLSKNKSENDFSENYRKLVLDSINSIIVLQKSPTDIKIEITGIFPNYNFLLAEWKWLFSQTLIQSENYEDVSGIYCFKSINNFEIFNYVDNYDKCSKYTNKDKVLVPEIKFLKELKDYFEDQNGYNFKKTLFYKFLTGNSPGVEWTYKKLDLEKNLEKPNKKELFDNVKNQLFLEKDIFVPSIFEKILPKSLRSDTDFKKGEHDNKILFDYIGQVAVTYDIWYLLQSVINADSGGAAYINSLKIQKSRLPILSGGFLQMFNFQRYSNLDDQYNYSLFKLFTQKLKTNLMLQNIFEIFQDYKSSKQYPSYLEVAKKYFENSDIVIIKQNEQLSIKKSLDDLKKDLNDYSNAENSVDNEKPQEGPQQGGSRVNNNWNSLSNNEKIKQINILGSKLVEWEDSKSNGRPFSNDDIINRLSVKYLQIGGNVENAYELFLNDVNQIGAGKGNIQDMIKVENKLNESKHPFVWTLIGNKNFNESLYLNAKTKIKIGIDETYDQFCLKLIDNKTKIKKYGFFDLVNSKSFEDKIDEDKIDKTNIEYSNLSNELNKRLNVIILASIYKKILPEIQVTILDSFDQQQYIQSKKIGEILDNFFKEGDFKINILFSNDKVNSLNPQLNLQKNICKSVSYIFDIYKELPNDKESEIKKNLDQSINDKLDSLKSEDNKNEFIGGLIKDINKKVKDLETEKTWFKKISPELPTLTKIWKGPNKDKLDQYQYQESLINPQLNIVFSNLKEILNNKSDCENLKFDIDAAQAAELTDDKQVKGEEVVTDATISEPEASAQAPVAEESVAEASTASSTDPLAGLPVETRTATQSSPSSTNREGGGKYQKGGVGKNKTLKKGKLVDRLGGKVQVLKL